MIVRYLCLFLLLTVISCKPESYQDVSFFSEAFQTERHYRIYLPESYHQNSEKRYPVIYYFHGWGGRYKWSNHDAEEDIFYPENGRKEPPFVMEWKDYVKDHEVIIVTWDGYEPNLHQGKKMREGIPYGNCSPYDYMRAHEKEDHHWGWDYRLYFRDQVQHVDQHFRTIADRDHRAITGLSMGGLTSYYVAGQNKDLVSSVSSFDPADNIPMYGPKGYQVAFPVLEMYRSLKGLAVRLTMTDGDWLKYNDWEMKRIFEVADLSHFEFHLADYPDHWTADADEQLDFHMKEFSRSHPTPQNWNHICPAFPSFKVWGYDIDVQRAKPALTILENVCEGHMKVVSRTFIPDGPIVMDEKLSISTDNIYSPEGSYQLISYNLSSNEFAVQDVKATTDGRLKIELGGGGHLIGINDEGPGKGAKLNIVFKNEQEYLYFEAGKPCDLNFKLVNVGTGDARNIEIRVSSEHPHIDFAESKIQVSAIGSGNYIELENQFDFKFTQYVDTMFVGSLNFELISDGVETETQHKVFFVIPESPYVDASELIILDGRSLNDIPIYGQGPNVVQQQTISGGKGNGNGLLEPGEEGLLYLPLPMGMGSNDINTYHRTYMINHLDDPYISVKNLDYEEKLNQAGATSISTILSISKDSPKNHEFDLWFQIESLYNDKQDTTSRATIYAHKYDYRRASLKLGH